MLLAMLSNPLSLGLSSPTLAASTLPWTAHLCYKAAACNDIRGEGGSGGRLGAETHLRSIAADR